MDAPFSEMIRLGIPMIPGRRLAEVDKGVSGGWIHWDSHWTAKSACVIGTGMLAAGIEFTWEARKVFPILDKTVRHPKIEDFQDSLRDVASDLFEEFGWSREEVAAFIAEKEREDEQEKKAAVKEGAEVAG